jgi:hypothetical protein
MSRLARAKNHGLEYHLHAARMVSMRKYGGLLPRLAVACRDPVSLELDLSSSFLLDYAQEDEAALKKHAKALKADPANAHLLPLPRIAEFGRAIGGDSARWNYEALRPRFEDGQFGLVDVKCAHNDKIIGIEYTYIVNMHANATWLQHAMVRVSGKRNREDADDETSTSPRSAPKKARLAAPAAAPATQLINLTSDGDDAMELDAPVAPDLPDERAMVFEADRPVDDSFAADSWRILDEKPTVRLLPPPDEMGAIEHAPRMLALVMARAHGRTMESMIAHDEQVANAREDRLLQDLSSGVNSAPTDPMARFTAIEQLVDAKRPAHAEINIIRLEITRLQAVHREICDETRRTILALTPPTRELEDQFLAVMHLIVIGREALLDLLISSLPRCAWAGCANFVHWHFGEDCCKHRCIRHRDHGHFAHVVYHPPATSPAPAADVVLDPFEDEFYGFS